ncbi:hypothetical protein GGTG_02321 [Gaeumannomyces tritici R3-111a-1]|uniref:Aldehyde dehydrogenase domain-containing protein n=1 Tax=Gaeumannomyces tritici (strain R3-111a-1) TaxID=644352 RepID=J3NM17_GAET3|nr:hypothetical protein GGTG_02321 [Gaeumannomyces tritici R3-111a-1]EJT82348.1 hypothetical protein GGTG_02321 [Gaeumannomyces tritici R3-111a-1]
MASSSDQGAALARIRGSATDGRAHNPIFRRAQLKRLHDAVAAHADELERAAVAAVKDSAVTPHDARLELCFAVRAVRELSASPRLDVAAAHELEYAVSRGRDARGARRPVGIVVVSLPPAAHTPVYSVVSAVAAAVAGGNCVVLQIEQTIRELPAILGRMLTEALDRNTFATAAAAEIDAAIKGRDDVTHFIMGSDAEATPTPSPRLLVSASHRRVVAVVERDADLDKAASALVTARFGFGGASPYAPDLVLVNEWVQQGFLEAVLRRTSSLIAAHAASAAGNSRLGSGGELLRRIKAEGKAKVVTEGDFCSVVVVEQRDSFLLKGKINQSCLNVHTVTSMDDAIDLINVHGKSLAAFVFTQSLANGKYLTQFLDADVMFVNQIPTRILVGPAHPQGYPLDPAMTTMSPDLFTVPTPVYVEPVSSAQDSLEKAVRDATPASMATLARELAKPLKALKRPLKQVHVGFFEQGIMTGALLVLGTFCTAAGLLGLHGYRFVAARSRMG